MSEPSRIKGKEFTAYIKEIKTIKVKVKSINLLDARKEIDLGNYEKIYELKKQVEILANTLKLSKTFVKTKNG